MDLQIGDIISKVESSASELIALSNYIELTPENSKNVDTIIDTLRNNKKKIVVPIYNADKVLYPVRSQKYLIPDIEYLVLENDVAQSPDVIRNFSNSLAGYKLRDETMSGSAIMAIEKYLLTLHRQKRAKLIQKRSEKKTVLHKLT